MAQFACFYRWLGNCWLDLDGWASAWSPQLGVALPIEMLWNNIAVLGDGANIPKALESWYKLRQGFKVERITATFKLEAQFKSVFLLLNLSLLERQG